MNNLDFQYQNLLQDILDNGVEKETRNGKTLSVFGWQIRHKMSEGFPLLTTKKMAINSVMTELKWFLKGRTDIQYLRDNNCKIWDGDFEKAGRIDGTLGPIYGYQWRNWNGNDVDGDQLASLISDLKTNPDSRRLIVSAWNVDQLPEMSLPPCHYSFQVYTRKLTFHERSLLAIKAGWKQEYYIDDYDHEDFDQYDVPRRSISLLWNQRSVDTFLGLPFNIASYGMLLHLLAKEVHMIPEELIGNLGDTHLYLDHKEQAMLQLSRTPFNLPKLNLLSSDLLNGEFDYQITEYNSHPSIKAPLFN